MSGHLLLEALRKKSHSEMWQPTPMPLNLLLISFIYHLRELSAENFLNRNKIVFHQKVNLFLSTQAWTSTHRLDSVLT